MQPLIYDVSVSIDGYISGPDGDIAKFPADGPIVDDYFERLSHYHTVLMGRRTYEFGYQFGLKAGDNPYPHMRSVIFSRTIKLPPRAAVEIVTADTLETIRALKSQAAQPLYLCGGGEFASYLAKAGLINQLILKRVPILLGGGTKLFGAHGARLNLKHIGSTDYGDGSILQKFECKG